MTARDGKPCKKCGTSDWHKNGNCKQCKYERKRLWRKAHPERHRELNRRYREAHPGKVKETKRDYLKNNLDKIRERNARYRKDYPDRIREYQSRYQKANRDKDAAKSNRYRTKKTQAGGSYTPAEFKELCEQYDYRCLRCGKQEPEIKLAADHVLPVDMGGTSDISNIQPLCKSCNSWKCNRHIDFCTKPGIMRWIQNRLFG